ncbi:MAG: class II aldolase/adducin family protein [Clostridia bacterium]
MVNSIIDYAKILLKENLCKNIGGVIAVKTDDNSMLVTKKNADFSMLTEANIIKISLNDNNSDYAIFSNIFKHKASISCILHTNPANISTCANVGVEIPAVLDDMAQIVGISCKVACCADKIVKSLNSGRNCCLLKNDGAICTGRSLNEAYTASLVLEKACKVFIEASVLGGAKPINKLEAKLMNIIYKKKYSKQADKDTALADLKPANKFTEERLIIIGSGKRLLKSNLVQGTWGNTSIKLNATQMLVTPSGRDYVTLHEEELPIVEIADPSIWNGGLKPTSERKIHAAVLRDNTELNAVIHSHPTYGSILASAHCDLDVILPEHIAILGNKIYVSSYGLPGTKKLCKGTVEGFSKSKKGTFMANHGVLSAGKTMDEAFDIIQAIEDACKVFIEKKTLEATGAKAFSIDLLHNYFAKMYTAK